MSYIKLNPIIFEENYNGNLSEDIMTCNNIYNDFLLISGLFKHIIKTPTKYILIQLDPYLSIFSTKDEIISECESIKIQNLEDIKQEDERIRVLGTTADFKFEEYLDGWSGMLTY